MKIVLATPGSLRETVVVQRHAEGSPDRYGNPTPPSWSTILTTRADIAPLKGGEEMIAARLTGVTQLQVVIRSDSLSRTVTTADRVVWNGLALNIRSIINLDGRNRFLTLLCEAGVAT